MAKYYLFFILVWWQAGFAQNAKLDSLTNALKNNTSSFAQVDILNQLSYEFISQDNVKAIEFNNKALSLAEKTGYKKGEGMAHTYRGVYESLAGEFSNARYNLKKGLQLATESGDQYNIGYTLLQTGNFYFDQGRVDSSAIFFKKAHEILKDSLYPINLAKLYRSYATFYKYRSEYQLQKVYTQRSLTIAEALKNKFLIETALLNLASLQANDNNFSKALEIIDRVEKLANTEPKDLETLSTAQYQRALISFREGNFAKGLILIDSAKAYYTRKSLTRNLVNLLIEMGRMFSNRGQYDLALNNFYEGLRLAELKGFNVEILDLHIQIGWVAYFLGEFNEALEYGELTLKEANKLGFKDRLASAMELKGGSLIDLKRYDSAKHFLNKEVELYREINSKYGEANGLYFLGNLEESKGNFKDAIEYYQSSLALSKQSDNKYCMAWDLISLGAVYIKLSDHRQGEKFLSLAESLSKSTNNNEVRLLVYFTRRKLAVRVQNYKEAFLYFTLGDNLKDSIHRHELAKRQLDLKRITETEKRERYFKEVNQEAELAKAKIKVQEALLSERDTLLYSAIVIITFFALGGLVLFRFFINIKRLNASLGEKNKRMSEQKEEIEAQAKQLSESNLYISKMNEGLNSLVAEKTEDLKITNEELIKHNNELIQFSYTVSHNLRGPVARLLGLTHLLNNEKDSSSIGKMIEMVSKASNDLDMVIKDLNKVIDIRNELYKSNEIVDLKTEWEVCYGLLNDNIKYSHDISCDFTRAPSLYGIKAFVHSILFNLLSNALKFKSSNRELKVKALSRIDQEQLVIEISDNGIGFDAFKHNDEVFKLFKRFHPHIDGRGLGLYLVKMQVETMNGTIRVQSVADVGTTFTLVYPLSFDLKE